jgi:hypothetical protein
LTPEDVLLEAMSAVSQYGDSTELRVKMCIRLAKAIQKVHELALHEDPLKVRPE